MSNERVVFCFHTHDHEFNFGIGFLSSYLKQNGIDTGLVIYRETENKIDAPEDVVSRILETNPTIVAFSVMTFNWHKIKEIISLLRKGYNGLIVAGGIMPFYLPTKSFHIPMLMPFAREKVNSRCWSLLNYMPRAQEIRSLK